MGGAAEAAQARPASRAQAQGRECHHYLTATVSTQRRPSFIYAKSPSQRHTYIHKHGIGACFAHLRQAKEESGRRGFLLRRGVPYEFNANQSAVRIRLDEIGFQESIPVQVRGG